ncbi:MAG: glycosyltransferase [bacterium]|nr:glycosyltransferase [bacterium]
MPIYNEEDSIGVLLDKIETAMRDYDYKILAINDGSTDNTVKILEKYATKLPLEIFTHKFNRGLGETIRDAFERVVEVCKPDDIIISLDSDNTHPPMYFPEMIKRINEGFDIVIASRFQKGGNQYGLSLHRKVMSILANGLMRICVPIKGVRDYTCGFRAYRAKAICDAIYIFKNDFISLKNLGFTVTLETLVKLRKFKLKATEIPLKLRYDLKQGKSKLASRITILGYLCLIVGNVYPLEKDRRRAREIVKLWSSKSKKYF